MFRSCSRAPVVAGRLADKIERFYGRVIAADASSHQMNVEFLARPVTNISTFVEGGLRPPPPSPAPRSARAGPGGPQQDELHELDDSTHDNAPEPTSRSTRARQLRNGPPLYAAHSLSLRNGPKAADASLRDAFGSLDPARSTPTTGSYEGHACRMAGSHPTYGSARR